MSKSQNPENTRKYARSWDPYFKQSNVKKLKNLLNKAIKKGDNYVTIENSKTGEPTTLTLFELEQLINEKESHNYKKHFLTNEDPIHWYSISDPNEPITLSLVYKDKDNNKYVDEVKADLSSYQTEYVFSKGVDLKSTIIPYSHTIIGNDKKEYDLDYQIYVEKYPANKIFVNESKRIDLFTYNIGYLFIGERNHNANSNNSIDDFVPFVNDFELYNGKISYYTEETAYKKSFVSQLNDINRKTGYNEETKILSYIASDSSYLTKLETEENDYEKWILAGRNVCFLPKYSSNSSATKNNNEIKTAYSQIGMTPFEYTVDSFNVQIYPYTCGDGWYKIEPEKEYGEEYIKTANKYKEIASHVKLLKNDVDICTHTLDCSLKKTIVDNSEIQYTYLSENITVDIANSGNTYIKYLYTIDNGEEKEYDFSSKKYLVTYLNDLGTYVNVNLCPCETNYTLAENNVSKMSGTIRDNIIKLKSDNGGLFYKDYTLTVNSLLKDPITETTKDSENWTFNVYARSNPSLTTNETRGTKYKMSSNVRTENDIDYVDISMTLPFENSIVECSYQLDSVYMFSNNSNNEWTYNNTIQIENCYFVYSYTFANSGIVSNFDAGETTNTYTSPDSEHQYIINELNNLQLEYSYTYTEFKLTDPEVSVVSSILYDVTYIGDKAVVHICSDDFNVWGNETLNIFNTNNTTYLVKNSYIVCDAIDTDSEITLSYIHKSDIYNSNHTAHTCTIATYNPNISTINVTQNSITYEVEDLNISTYWEYDYDVISTNNSKVYKYNSISLANVPGDNRKTVTLRSNNVNDFISTAIDNIIFKALYDRFDTDNVNTGFCACEDELTYPYNDGSVHSSISSSHLLRPLFENSFYGSIELSTITNLILVDNEPYPLQSEYYLVKLDDADDEYYLYCIFNAPNNLASENKVQILPPLLYHLNMFDVDDNSLNNNDYEFYTDENGNSVTVNLTCPVNEKNTYMLYGFDRTLVETVDTVNDNYASSYYVDKTDLTEFTIPNCCKVNFEYKFHTGENNVKKLEDFTKTVANKIYTYTNKYTGYTYTYAYEGNTEIDNEIHVLEYTYHINTSKQGAKTNLVAYVKTIFTDGAETNTQTVTPVFRFDEKSKNVIVNTGITISPEVLSNYSNYVLPNWGEYPKIETYTPVYT